MLKLIIKAVLAVLAKKPAAPAVFDTAERIVRALERRGAKIARGPGERNIVYVEGATFRDDADGNTLYEKNDDAPDMWNDVRLLLQFASGKPVITHWWQATTEPGKRYTVAPIASDGAGAARIILGYQECWQVGLHRGYEALAQTGGMCSVTRDKNKDYKRDGDKVTTGWYGINQHHGHDVDADGSIGPHSAGCLVVPGVADHRAFMAELKSDPRYRANPKHVWGTTVIEAAELD